MFLVTLQKFWKSNKKITIVYGLKTQSTQIDQNQILPFIEDAVNTFLYDWEYTIVQGLTTTLNGWLEQQVNKIHYSCSQETYTIVFDCKNFLFQNLYFESYFKDNKVIVTPIIDSSLSMFDDTKKYYPNIDLPFIPEPLTPWIWKNELVQKMKTYLIEKTNNWENFNGSEFLSYYLYIIAFEKRNDFYLVNKRYDGVTYHHRLRNISEIELRAEALKKVGIIDLEISIWEKTVVPYAMFAKT
jgi:hypothetical protein